MITDQVLGYVLINAVVMTAIFLFSCYVLFLRYGLPVYHVMGLYQLYFLLGYVVRPWELYLTGQSSTWAGIGTVPDGPHLLWVTVVIACAHFSMLAGFVITNPKFGPVPSLQPINFEIGSRTGFNIAVIMCLMLGAYGTYHVIGTGFETDTASAYESVRDARGAFINTEVSGYQTVFAEFVSITLLMLFAVRPTRRFAVVLIVLFVAFRAVGGSGRNAFVAVSIGTIFMALINRRRRLPPPMLIVAALISLALFNIVGSDRLALRRAIAGEQTFGQIFTNYLSGNNQPAVTANTQEFDVCASILQVIPDQSGYSYGTQYLRILIWPIPRQLWLNKPVYTSIIDLNDYGDFRNLSWSIFADSYMTIGIVGMIIVLFLISVGLNRFYARISSRPTPLTVMFYFCVIIYLPVLLRDGPVVAAYFYITQGICTWLLCRSGKLKLGLRT